MSFTKRAMDTDPGSGELLWVKDRGIGDPPPLMWEEICHERYWDNSVWDIKCRGECTGCRCFQTQSERPDDFYPTCECNEKG